MGFVLDRLGAEQLALSVLLRGDLIQALAGHRDEEGQNQRCLSCCGSR